eukprot:gene9007-2960_t
MKNAEIEIHNLRFVKIMFLNSQRSEDHATNSLNDHKKGDMWEHVHLGINIDDLIRSALKQNMPTLPVSFPGPALNNEVEFNSLKANFYAMHKLLLQLNNAYSYYEDSLVQIKTWIGEQRGEISSQLEKVREDIR